jgi:hypothetical protein
LLKLLDLRQLLPMDLLTEPVIKQPRHIPDTRNAKDWLDALATGTCDQRIFMRGVGDLLRRVPDSGWDMLALLDQYYRRGKIDADTFTSLKAHLQNLLLGKAGGEGNVPPPTLRDALPKTPDNSSSNPPVPPPQARAVANMASAPYPASTAAEPARDLADTTRHRPERELAEGDVLRGRYRVQKLLGQGGMGSVFEAIDQFRVDESPGDQRVAVKVLHSAVLKRSRLFAELRREFQHVQSLSHPNIVRVHEFDRDGDIAFFTMEYLSGALLSRVLSGRKRPVMDRRYALAIVRDVGAAIAHAHSRGVVHGDLNPGNVFVTDNGDIRVLDFGAAHKLRRGPWISELSDPRNVAVATPSFASCELLEGEAADARDDVYALACVTYLLLSGNHPFQDLTALKARSLRMIPKRPFGLSHRQWRALKAGLQLNRARRPADLQAWLRELDLRAAAPHLPVLPSLLTTHARRPSGMKWIAVFVAAAVIAAGAWWAPGHVDSMVRAGAAVDTKLRALFAQDIEPAATGTAAPADAQTHAAAVSPVPVPAVAVPAIPENQIPAAPRAAARPTGDVAHAVESPSNSRSVPATNVSRPPATPIPTTAGMIPGQTGSLAGARIELAADNVAVAPTEAVARVVVRRSRSLRGDVSFSWWTESGTAKPGRDFVAVKSQVEHIENGKSSVSLLVPIVMDPARRQERNFYIVIGETSDNAALGPRTLTMVTIPELD